MSPCWSLLTVCSARLLLQHVLSNEKKKFFLTWAPNWTKTCYKTAPLITKLPVCFLEKLCSQLFLFLFFLFISPQHTHFYHLKPPLPYIVDTSSPWFSTTTTIPYHLHSRRSFNCFLVQCLCLVSWMWFTYVLATHFTDWRRVNYLELIVEDLTEIKKNVNENIKEKKFSKKQFFIKDFFFVLKHLHFFFLICYLCFLFYHHERYGILLQLDFFQCGTFVNVEPA